MDPDLPQLDAARRQRVIELIRTGALVDAEDFYHAAMVFQHGTTVDDYWRAHELALKAGEMGYRKARWLAAAAYDRWLMQQGRPQKYGTQFRAEAGAWTLWKVDPSTTDEDRARWDVKTLDEATRRAAALPAAPASDAKGASGLAPASAPPLPLAKGEGGLFPVFDGQDDNKQRD